MPSKSLSKAIEIIEAVTKIANTSDEAVLILQQIILDLKTPLKTSEIVKKKATSVESSLGEVSQQTLGILSHMIDDGVVFHVAKLVVDNDDR